MLQHNFSFQLLIKQQKLSACCTNTDSNITLWKDLENDHNSSLSVKPSKLELLFNQFNNATPENGNDPEKCSSPNIMTLMKCMFPS